MTDLHATLPDGWHEVPLLGYCHYLAATDLPGEVVAIAGLVQVKAEDLLLNMRTYAQIRAELEPLLRQAPPTELVLETFLHAGCWYTHAGNMETISAGQLEGLLATLKAHEAAPTLAAPALLALLYRPAGLGAAEWTAQDVAEAALAFETLPVSVGWPALQGFILASGPCALSFQQYSALRSQVSELLETLTAALPSTGASPGFWQRPLNAAARRSIASATKMLGDS